MSNFRTFQVLISENSKFRTFQDPREPCIRRNTNESLEKSTDAYQEYIKSTDGHHENIMPNSGGGIIRNDTMKH